MDLDIEFKRFRQIREDQGYTQTEFADVLGLPSSTADIERGKVRISGKTTMLLLKNYNINPLWLFGESTKKYLNPQQVDVLPKAITINQHGHENILLVNAKASAGYGQNIGDVEFVNKLPAFHFPLAQFQNATFRGFEIRGDSMLPLVYSGDWVLAKAVSSFSEIKNDKIYVVVDSESIRLKKLQKINKEQNLELISLNAEYAPVVVSAQSVLELWEYHSKISFGQEVASQPSLSAIFKEINELKRLVEG
ncbi:MAG: LexA family transcriptional regulator [Flavobacteriales bacterium]|nr:LexA family transcriptional regulator [Flavobacteriales bacterium]